LASRDDNVKAQRVCWSILQGLKRGCAEVPTDFIVKTMRKHQKALTQQLPRISDENMEKFRRVFRDIWRSKREVRAGRNVYTAYGVDKRMRHFADRPANPGFNACDETTRAGGGRAGHVRAALLDELSEYSEIPEGLTLSAWPLVSMTERKPGLVVENRVLPVATNKLARRLASRTILAKGGQCEATVAGILEPLKCRLITKGSGLPYWAAQPMQRAMWERMQHFDAFALTGRPMDAADLYDIETKCRKLGLDDFVLNVSGDYAAATDGLSQQINSCCLEEAMAGAGLIEEERDVCRAVLGNHKIHYIREGQGGKSAALIDGEHGAGLADGLKRHEYSIQQSNGQLMGSVLSFPVLCAINLACFKLALDEYLGREIAVEDLPVKINGDDIAFRANEDFYRVWLKWIRIGGFTPSQGKNYISRSFWTINSEGYHVQQRNGKLALTKMGFLNTGLLYCGRTEYEVDWRESGAKVGLRTENREMPFTAKVNRVITESNNPRRTLLRVHELYRADIAYHTHRGEINMHAAPELGGLGIVLPDGCTTRFTAWQQRVAGYLRSRWKSRDFGTKLTEEGQEPVWDLNQPMGVEGRVTYQLKKSVDASPVLDVRPGKVVSRAKLEPLRENEERWGLESNCLMNYQVDSDRARGEWKIRQLSKDDLERARSYTGSKVTAPLYWNEELRVQYPAREATPVDDEHDGEDGPIPERECLDVPLRRTDSDFVAVYKLPGGRIVEFSRYSKLDTRLVERPEDVV